MANSYNLNSIRKCDEYIQEMFEIFGCYFLVDQKRFVMAE